MMVTTSSCKMYNPINLNMIANSFKSLFIKKTIIRIKDVITDTEWKNLSTKFLIIRYQFTDKYYHKKNLIGEEANQYYNYMDEFGELYLILLRLINKYYENGNYCLEYPFDHSIPDNFPKNKFKSNIELYKLYKLLMELIYNTLRYKFEGDEDFQKLIDFNKKMSQKMLNNIKQGYID